MTTLRVGLVVSIFLWGIGKQFSFFFFGKLSSLFPFLFSETLPMDDLTKHWNRLSLSEREGDDICIKRDRCSTEHLIAGFFLTKRALNMDAVARTFKPLWRVDNGFTVSNEGAHKVVFSFDSSEDVDRILSGEPWSFDKSLVVLQRYNRLTSLDELAFEKVSFWVQVHNIPIGYRSKSVAEDICEAIGVVDRSTEVAECEGGNYVRVRVTLDVYQPLCRGRIIKMEGGEKTWVNFRYKCLPNICYWCGCFDHNDKDCDIWVESKGSLQTSSQQFGSWLRANQSGPSRKNVVHVPGFYEGRAENTSTRRRRERKQPHTQVKTWETTINPEKETYAMEADPTDSPNPEICADTSQNGKSSQPFQECENMGEYFSQKIREIDKDLDIDVNPTNPAQAEITAPHKENSPLFDLGNIRSELEGDQCIQQVQNLVRTPLGNHGTPLHDITNTPQRLGSTDATLQAKWKRISRPVDNPPVLNVESLATNNTKIGSKRPISKFTDHSELPRKKLLVSYNDKENSHVLAEAGSQPRQEQ